VIGNVPAIFCAPGGAGARCNAKTFLKKNLGKFIMKFFFEDISGQAMCKFKFFEISSDTINMAQNVDFYF
jgi:hypothetical protein